MQLPHAMLIEAMAHLESQRVLLGFGNTICVSKLLIQLLQPLVARHHRVEEQLAKVLHERLRPRQRRTQRVTPTGVEQRLQRVPRGRLARLAHARRLRLALQLLLGLQLTLL